MQVKVTPEQHHMMRHALGLTRVSKEYRNYYAAEPDDKNCNALVEAGYMQRGNAIPGGLVYFFVTEAGRKVIYGT